MVRLPSYDERPADCTGQAARGQAGWGQENLATADGEVCTKVDREGGKAACGTEQLAGGVKAGIEGGIRAMRLLWSQHFQE